ncbi:hypothetical protein WISP_38706 [Willisornis vidua]|uniref:Uncharacterized protein n=1 Tax=Willisornis vidua TaxID=1566151 RepID=A0ABQ9DKJ5_9PASS|nr:hypothetical protein WISP_38706 [Willisornis vidua]
MRNSSGDDAHGHDGAMLVQDSEKWLMHQMRGLNNLEECIYENVMKFSKRNCQILYLGITFHTVKDFRVLLSGKLSGNQQFAVYGAAITKGKNFMATRKTKMPSKQAIDTKIMTIWFNPPCINQNYSLSLN